MIGSSGEQTMHNNVYLQNSINLDIVSIIFALGVALQELQVLGNSRIKYPNIIMYVCIRAGGRLQRNELTNISFDFAFESVTARK